MPRPCDSASASVASLPASACTLSTQGSFGADRITKIVYDAAGEVVQNRVAVAVTGEEAAERTLSYTSNGRLQYLIDADGQKTQYVYDGLDRPQCLIYPSTTRPTGYNDATQATALATAGAVSGDCVTTGDYEKLTYDANSNMLTRRLRDATSIAFTFDNLNRATLKNLPAAEPDVTYVYDNLGRLTSASQTGNGLSFGWDALSRKTSEAGPNGTTSFAYDVAGRKTAITYSTSGGGSALTVNYGYLTTGELNSITNGAASLAAFAYDALGNRTLVTFGNSGSQAFSFDPVSRLSQLTNNLSGTANDLTATFAYNPAGQISSTVRTGDAYAFSGIGSGTTSTTSNGLNQQVTIGGASATWDSKGNLHFDPTSAKSYCYSSENLLTGSGSTCSPPTTTLAYDPALRLYQLAGAATTRFAYDGVDAIAEYNSSNALQRRFVFDPTTGQSVVQYEGTGASSPRYLSTDERGSVISLTDSSGGLIAINTYDEYGKPAAANVGRLQYTGQRWLSELGAYDYKARVYLPHLGIFAQTDPIGQAARPNLYTYVHADPVNLIDQLGLQEAEPPDIVITHRAVACQNGGIRAADGSCATRNLGAGGFFGGIGGLGGGGDPAGGAGRDRDSNNQSQCPLDAKFSTFFNENYVPALSVSLDYNVNLTLLLGLSAHETGYGTSRIYREQNNPLGMTPGGDGTAGLAFPSLFAGWQAWGDMFGPSVQGVGNNVPAFMNGLLSAGYNTQNASTGGDPGWSAGVLGSIAGVQKRLPLWTVHPECAQ